MRDPLVGRATLVDIAVGFAFGSALIGLLSGIAQGLVITPIELGGAGSGSFDSLTVIVFGRAFSFLLIVQYVLVLALLAVVAILVARRFRTTLWADEPAGSDE